MCAASRPALLKYGRRLRRRLSRWFRLSLDVLPTKPHDGNVASKSKRKLEQSGRNSSPDVEKLRGQLDAYMAKEGLRSTGQRRTIVNRFFEESGHCTVDDLLDAVRDDDPGIGYATVYRTLKMLAAGGIANEHKFSDGMTRYELADDDSHHDHLICLDCGKIQEFEEPLIEELQTRIAERHSFRIVDHKHELYGKCETPNCPERALVEKQPRKFRA